MTQSNKSKIMAITKVSPGCIQIIIVLLVLLLVTLIAVIATFIPLYVAANNKINYNKLISNMRSATIEQELMMLIAAINQTDPVEEVLVNGTFTLRLESSEDLSDEGMGNYQIRKNTFFDLIEVISFHLALPTSGVFPAGDNSFVEIQARDFDPVLDMNLWSSFLYNLDDAYLPINATGALALGAPCATTNPPTCTITPGSGSMPNMINTIHVRSSRVEFIITPANGFAGQPYIPTGTLQANLLVRLKSFA